MCKKITKGNSEKEIGKVMKNGCPLCHVLLVTTTIWTPCLQKNVDGTLVIRTYVHPAYLSFGKFSCGVNLFRIMKWFGSGWIKR
mgnify:FL=1